MLVKKSRVFVDIREVLCYEMKKRYIRNYLRRVVRIFFDRTFCGVQRNSDDAFSSEIKVMIEPLRVTKQI